MARPSMTICRLTKYATDNTFLCILWWQWPCVCDVSYFYMITIVGYYYVCFIYKLMRFHCCHSVRRVLAKEPTEANDIKLEYLSIPVNSSYLFQMVKTRTQCKDNQSFRQIFKKNWCLDKKLSPYYPTLSCDMLSLSVFLSFSKRPHDNEWDLGEEGIPHTDTVLHRTDHSWRGKEQRRQSSIVPNNSIARRTLHPGELFTERYGNPNLDNTTMLDRRLSNVVHFCWANVEYW